MLGTIAAIAGIVTGKSFLTAGGVIYELPSLFGAPSVMTPPAEMHQCEDCETLDDVVGMLTEKTQQEYRGKITLQIIINILILTFLFYAIYAGSVGWLEGVYQTIQNTDFYKLIGIIFGANALFVLIWRFNKQGKLHEIQKLECAAKEGRKAFAFASIDHINYFVRVASNGNIDIKPVMFY